MSREKELVKNTIVLGVGNFLPKIVSIVTLPILTAGLTKAEYGLYDLIATLIMLLMPIATLQIQSAAFRFLIDCRNNHEKSSEIISNIFVVTIPIALVTSVIIQGFFGDETLIVRCAISLYFIADSLYLTSGQIARGLGGNKVYSVASILVSSTNMIGIVLGISILKAGMPAVLLSLTVANSIGTIIIVYKMQIISYLSYKICSVKKIKELLSYSWPMVPNNLSNWVLKLSDRLVITAVLGVEANAIYAVANKIPNLLSLAQLVMVMAWQENASIAVKDKDADKYFSKLFDIILSLMVGVTAVLIAFTPVMFRILIRGDYDQAYTQMPILILGMFFYCMSAFQGGIYVAHKKTKSVGITTMTAAGINLIIDLLFVKSWGITAGSISTLAAYFALYIFRMHDSLKFQPMDYKVVKQVGLFVFLACMLLMCYLRNFYVDIINACIGIVAFCILNRRLIVSIFQKLLKMKEK